MARIPHTTGVTKKASDDPANATNYFDQGFADSVDSEKLKMLKLIADHGAEGAQIYDAAQARQSGQSGTNTAAALAGSVNAGAANAQVSADMERRNAVYNKILADSAAQSSQGYRDQGAAEAIYKDSVSGDMSNRLAADQSIADAHDQWAAAQAAAAAARAKSSRANAGFGLTAAPIPTIPASYFEDQLHRNDLGFEPGLGDPTDPSYRKAPVFTPATASATIPEKKGGFNWNPFAGLTASLNAKPSTKATTILPAGTTLKALAKGQANAKRPTKTKG